MSLVQKILLWLSIMVIFFLVAFLTRKKFVFESKKNSLFLEMIRNISSNLDKLDTDLDQVLNRAEAAKNKLKQLAIIQRENLMICALLREKRKQISKEETNKKLVTWKEQG